MSSTILSSRLPANLDSLKLTDERCVRWFVEALHLLRKFDQTASRESLRSASSLLNKCMESYPNDELPKFYFGITSLVLDDMNQEAAISVFKDFLESDVFEVRAAATYNLVLAYVETYNYNLFSDGKALLDDLLRDLKDHGAPIGQGKFRDLIDRLLGKDKAHVEQLYLQSCEVKAYLTIHLDLWSPRWTGDPKELKASANVLLSEVRSRRDNLIEFANFLAEERSEIWAWHWNNEGMIHEALAAVAIRQEDIDTRDHHLEMAIQCYKNAVKEAPIWDSARSNLGRLFLEVAKDNSSASEQLHRVLSGAEDQDYTHYNLGLIATMQQDEKIAIKHFEKAPMMLERRGRSANWIGARKMLAHELIKWQRKDEALELLKRLAVEYPDDDQVRAQIESLTD